MCLFGILSVDSNFDVSWGWHYNQMSGVSVAGIVLHDSQRTISYFEAD